MLDLLLACCTCCMGIVVYTCWLIDFSLIFLLIVLLAYFYRCMCL